MNAPPALPRASPWRAAALIAAGAVVAYASSFSAPFVFDDIPALAENPALRDFATALGGGAQGGGGLTLSGRPVLALSFALNYAFGGTSVAGYHAVNLAIHIASAFALLGLLRRTLVRMPRLAPQHASLALAIAFLWAVHPLQTESVTYIVQRAEALMGFFYLFTLYAFARGLHSRSWLIASVAACAAGMATKEVMVTAPLVVLFYDRTFGAGTFRGALRARAPIYAAFAGTWLLLVYFVASTGGNRGGTVGFDVGVTPWAYAATQFEAVARYLGLSLWPSPLVFEYGTFWVRHVTDALPFAVIVVPVLAATIIALRRWPATGFAGACFFGFLAPSSLTPGTIQMIVEHRMYLSLAAVLSVLGVMTWLVLGRAARWPGAAAGALLVALTMTRNHVYRDERSLWALTVAQRPHNAIALRNLGLAELRAGRIDVAIALNQRALTENPASIEAHHNLGVAYSRRGQWPEAIEHYRAAAKLAPAFAEPHFNLGAALLEAGRTEEAGSSLQEALRLQPAHAEAHFLLGNAFAELGRLSAAAVEFETTLRLRPTHANAHVNLGNVLAQNERWAEAQAHYEAALRAAPELPDAHNNLGLILLQSGRVDAAIVHFERALAARPGFAAAERNLMEARAASRAGGK